MNMEEMIPRINELYHKQKAGTMTAAEKEEQALLRAEYIKAIRASLRGQIENTVVDYPDGSSESLADSYRRGHVNLKH